MCGRYFWTHDAEDALEEDFPELVDELLRQVHMLRAGDYTPAMKALALVGGASSGPASGTGSIASGNANGSLADITGRESGSPRRELTPQVLQWGFPGFDKGKLLINARAESVKDRPTFSRSFEQGRCVLPAAGFYEWDKSKERSHSQCPISQSYIWRASGGPTDRNSDLSS